MPEWRAMFKRYLGYVLVLFLLAVACKSKKTTLKDGDNVEWNDFVEFFPDIKLPYQLTDSVLLIASSDSSRIGNIIFSQFIPDTVLINQFGKGVKPKLYPLGKVVVKNAETYLFVKAVTPNKKVAYLLGINKEQQFVAAMPLLISDNDAATSTQSNMDTRYTVTRVKQKRNKEGQITYSKNVFVFNSAGAFTLILTESNDTQSPTVNTIINPIDTFPKKNKLSGDYLQDKKNYISIRDGATASKLLFFIHFEKDKGDCIGELKGVAKLVAPNIARYNEAGSPCTLEFVFVGRTVTMKEIGGCGSFRGIKCFFEGNYTRKKELISPKPGRKRS